MPATQTSHYGSQCKDFSPDDLDYNARSIAASTTYTPGTSVNVRGYRRLALAVTVAGTSPNVTWSITGKVRGQAATVLFTRAVGALATSLTASITAAQTVIYQFDNALDELTLVVTNNSGANAATLTANLVAQP